MLTAGTVTCIISIASDMDKLTSLIILLGVLIVFYIIGLIGNWIITKVMESGGIPVEGENPEDEEDDLEGAVENFEGQEENANEE